MIAVILEYIKVVHKVKRSISKGYEGYAFSDGIYPKTKEWLEKTGYSVETSWFLGTVVKPKAGDPE